MEMISLDVSDLPAPEPFQKIMALLPTLTLTQYLKVEHRQQPKLLYQTLKEMQFNFHAQRGVRQAYDIYIWQQKSLSPEGLINPNLASLDLNQLCGSER